MSTLGKVCLVITLLLLLVAIAPIPGPWGGWTPKLLVFHNQWSEKLRDAKAKGPGCDHSKPRAAKQELYKAMADVNGLTLGWDRFWIVPARAQNAAQGTPTVEKSPPGQRPGLTLNNIGTDNGMKDLQFTDDAGAQQLAKPIVHAFFGSAEGFTYAGEFRAVEITPNRTELEPVHPVSAEEIALWDVNAAWRLRTMVPPGQRTTVDDLYNRGRITAELTQQMDANIGRQEALLLSAQTGLSARQGELLGDPDRMPVPMRPEFTEGLLKVNEDVEEQRNRLLLEIDRLRREIKAATEDRDRTVEAMNQKVTTMPGASSQDVNVAGQP